ncbi:hypothetical protein FRC08_009800 [Ceratobasidium sp. 394]|nr:hypothetical protein FRC08_009800 [Ceratobasidium sp. 394]
MIPTSASASISTASPPVHSSPHLNSRPSCRPGIAASSPSITTIAMAAPCARPEPSPFHSPVASASPAFILRPDLAFAGARTLAFDCDHNHNLGLALVLVLDPDSGLVLGVPTPAALPSGSPMAASSRSTPTMTSIQTSPMPSHSPTASAPLTPVSVSLFTSRSPI